MTAGDLFDPEVGRDRCERWFVRRGLPHLIDDYSTSTDVLTRAAPFLGIVVFMEFFLVFGDRWRGWAQAGVFCLGLARSGSRGGLRQPAAVRRLWHLPDRVGLWELLLYFSLPAMFAGLGATDAVVVDVLFFVIVNAVLLAGAYTVTSWGLVPMGGQRELFAVVKAPGLDISAFRRWAMGNLVENRNRGIFAEWLVGQALDDTVEIGFRQEWDSWDLLYGKSKIEVKAAGRGQTWPQNHPSTPRFDIAPRAVRTKGRFPSREPESDRLLAAEAADRTDVTSLPTPGAWLLDSGSAWRIRTLRMAGAGVALPPPGMRLARDWALRRSRG